MIIYNELKKRKLIEDEKEFNEMIWLRQIKVNGLFLKSASTLFNKDKIETIQIGLTEFSLED